MMNAAPDAGRPPRRRFIEIFAAVLITVSFLAALRSALVQSGRAIRRGGMADPATRCDAQLAGFVGLLQPGEIVRYRSLGPSTDERYWQVQYALVPAIVVDRPGPGRVLLDLRSRDEAAANTEPVAAAPADTSLWRAIARSASGEYILFEPGPLQ